MKLKDIKLDPLLMKVLIGTELGASSAVPLCFILDTRQPNAEPVKVHHSNIHYGTPHRPTATSGKAFPSKELKEKTAVQFLLFLSY